MSQGVAIENVRARLRRVADLGPDATSGRYPNADLNREINRSFQRLREVASGNGHQLYLKQSAPATFTTGVLANTSFGTIPMPADCISVYGIDVVLSANRVISLYPVDWNQRNSFGGGLGQTPSTPEGFHVFNAGTENGAAITAGTIAILPAPANPWMYTTWYLPTWSDITDGAVFNVIAGWDDYLIWDAAIPFLAGDNDMQNAYQIAQIERAKAEDLVKQRATSVQRVGTGARRDVRSEQMGSRLRGRYPWL